MTLAVHPSQGPAAVIDMLFLIMEPVFSACLERALKECAACLHFRKYDQEFQECY